MIPAPDWSSHYDHGLLCLRANNFDEALTALDKAVAVGGGQLSMFPSRAEVLDRLRALEGTFRSDPSESAQASSCFSDEDCARLLTQLSALPETLQALILSPVGLVSSKSGGPLHQHAALAERQGCSLRLKRNFIGYLPPAILIEIGRYAILSEDDPSSHLALDLTGVCSQWRSIFQSDSTLWGQFKIDCSRRPRPGALESYVSTQLSKGIPSVIWIKGNHNAALRQTYRLLEGHGQTLRDFRASLNSKWSFEIVWNTLGTSALDLRVLHVSGPDSDEQIPAIPLPTFTLPALTELVLTGVVRSLQTSLLSLLHLAPGLERLELSKCQNVCLLDPTKDGTDRLRLPALRSLVLRDNVLYTGGGFRRTHLEAPLLEELLLLSPGFDYKGFLFPSGTTSNTACLRKLHIHPSDGGGARTASTQSASGLSRALREMPSLVDLSVRQSHTVVEDLVDTLAVRERDEEAVCPLLETLQLSRLGPVEGRRVMRMVRSRTKGIGRRTARLEKFRMDDELMDHETWEWLTGEETNGLEFENEDFDDWEGGGSETESDQ